MAALTRTERIDVIAARKVLACGEIDDEQKQRVRRYLARVKDGRATVQYEPSAKWAGRGRLFSKGESLQTMSRRVRHALAGDGHWDLDMVAAQPRLLQELCQSRDWSCPLLAHYIAHRDEMLATASAHYAVERDEAKQLFNTLLYGGGEEGWRQKAGRSSVEPWGPALAFMTEMRTLATLGVHAFPEMRDIGNKAKGRPKGDTSYEAAQTTMYGVLTDMENRCLMAASRFLESQGRPMVSFIYDGGLIERAEGETEPPMALMGGMAAAVKADTGYTTAWAVKPMDSAGRLALEDVEPVDESETGKVDDLFAARRLLRLLGGNIARDDSRLFVYNPATGVWETGERVLMAAAVRHARELVIPEEVMLPSGEYKEVQHNYGGDLVKMKRMLEVAETLVPDTQFVERTGDSSRFKLLFADGIYDGMTGTFTRGFNPAVVFFHRVERPFPAARDEELIAMVRRTLFEEAFHKAEMGQFYLNAWTYGIMGDIRWKKAYIAIGPSNCGKGLMTDTMVAAFPGLAQTFNPDALVYKANDSKDEAHKLMWLRDLLTARILIGNEMMTGEATGKDERQLDGALLNRLSSGGDKIAVRGHRQMPFSVTFRGQLFMLANDANKIRAEKSAAETRYQFVEFGKSYVDGDRALGPNELRGDPTIKTRFKTQPAVHDALFWVLMDNWDSIKERTSYWIPDCVKQESRLWLGTEDGFDLRKALETRFVFTGDAKDCVPFAWLASEAQEAGFVGTSNKLSKALSVMLPGTETKQARFQGKSQKVRTGVREREETEGGLDPAA
jgi:hypothetical protein